MRFPVREVDAPAPRPTSAADVSSQVLLNNCYERADGEDATCDLPEADGDVINGLWVGEAAAVLHRLDESDAVALPFEVGDESVVLLAEQPDLHGPRFNR